MTIKESCNYIRTQLRSIGRQVLSTRVESSERIAEPGVDRGEVIANLTLSYRHVEDAIMRLGKAIQAIDGGVSCYDMAQPGADCTVGPKRDDAAAEAKLTALRADIDRMAEESKQEQQHPFHSVPAKACDSKSYSP